MTFAESDLNVSQAEIDAIKAALANTGQADAMTNVIAEQKQKVIDYTLRYQLPDDRLRRLIRALVLFEIYGLIGQPVPTQHETKYKEAMQELKDVRDNKFPDLAPASPATVTTTANPGRWGSGKAQIKTR
ncbi:MAG: hypothetical protein ACYDH9_08190 [Limisphaerales bacterium]